MNPFQVLPATRAGRISALTCTLALAAVSLVGAPAATAQDEEAGAVVVTTEVLGSVVSQLVGDSGEVVVIMPSGANPHSFEPSARDTERLLGAAVVVSNGLDLEEGLLGLLQSAEDEGVTWFQAADHVAVREVTETNDHEQADPAGEGQLGSHGDDDDHAHGLEDPHFWTDPLAMRDVVLALAPVLTDAGLDVADHAEALAAELEALDVEVDEILSTVPVDGRKLVTGHQSLGYFADRYGFEQVGTVIPGLSTSGEPTARELAQLIDDIRGFEVPAVFAEVGTPQSVAQAVARDSGAELVELSTSQLPEGGTYQDLIRAIATTVAGALAG